MPDPEVLAVGLHNNGGTTVLLSEAFSRYGAKLKNVYWSVSAENDSDELVVSLWKHRFLKPEVSSIRYQDYVDRWSGHGNKEFRERIDKAFTGKQVVRVVVARTNNVDAVENGTDASNLVNEFHIREDWYGEVTQWDGNNFEITFTRT
jgi:hypothetical protein